ncbi:hypothetical protein BC830DRAFT_1166673 [Chytriomyces sp. MP71]|nr:hypothetical protein BC830DRAFT_1166673 [Chytriomyces sp. MP71]
MDILVHLFAATTGAGLRLLALSVYPLAVVGVISVCVVGLSALSVTTFSPSQIVGDVGEEEVVTNGGSEPPSVSTSPTTQKQAPTTPSQTTKMLKPGKKSVRKRDEPQPLASQLTNWAVATAIKVKQSPLPDAVAALLGTTLDRYKRVDRAFAVNDKVVSLSQVAVKHAISAASVAAGAAIKASVAYQAAPSYRELYGYETDESDSDQESRIVELDNANDFEVFEAFADGSTPPQRVVAKKLRAKKSLRKLKSQPSLMSIASSLASGAQPPAGANTSGSLQQPQIQIIPTLQDGPAVRIIKLDASIPGGFPFKETMESGVSTDASITGVGNLIHENDACASCGRVGPYRSTPFNDVTSNSLYIGLSCAKPSNADAVVSPSILGSLYQTSTTVAGRVVTASSTYLLGKETTEILLGSSEEEPNGTAGSPSSKTPLTEEDLFVQSATREARSALSHTPIRTFCVGGVFVATSLRTLLRARGSKLRRWFAGVEGDSLHLSEDTVREWMRDGVIMRDGTFFIDRDGTHFNHIINHLRGLALSPVLDSRVALYELRIEALFYNIVPLVVEIDERLNCLDLVEEEELKALEETLTRMQEEQEDGRDRRNTSLERTMVRPPSPAPIHLAYDAPIDINLQKQDTAVKNAPEVSQSPQTVSATSPYAAFTESYVPTTLEDMQQGVRQRKKITSPTSAVSEIIVSPIQSSPLSPRATTLFSSAYNLASSFVPTIPTIPTLPAVPTTLPTVKKSALTLANPDSGSDSDIFSNGEGEDDATDVEMLRTPIQRQTQQDGLLRNQLSGTQRVKDKSPVRSVVSKLSFDEDTFVHQTTSQLQQSQQSESEKSVAADKTTYYIASAPQSLRIDSIDSSMFNSSLETSLAHKPISADHLDPEFSVEKKLYNILMKRRALRQAIGISSQPTHRVDSPATVEEAVKRLNASTWESIVRYNAQRLSTSEWSPYREDLFTSARGRRVAWLEDVVEGALIKVGLMCGMPPPPRNDVIMNVAWSFGVGVAVAVQFGVVIVITWLLI